MSGNAGAVASLSERCRGQKDVRAGEKGVIVPCCSQSRRDNREGTERSWKTAPDLEEIVGYDRGAQIRKRAAAELTWRQKMHEKLLGGGKRLVVAGRHRLGTGSDDVETRKMRLDEAEDGRR